ncbi:MAG: tetratricopeptide repeat protein [Deltaproteobacteria bacterium]|nr:tetratricopeptide repeat protein [Deltaproteobacteria bacterium]
MLRSWVSTARAKPAQLLVLSAFLAACATQKKSVKSTDEGAAGDEEPGSSESDGSSGSNPTKPPSAEEMDAASADFLKAAERAASKTKGSSPDWGSVADTWSSFLDNHPGHPVGLYNLGVAQERAGKRELAEQAYRRAIDSGSAPRQAYENLAVMISRSGDSSAAFRIVEELVERDPGAAKARVMVAKAKLAEGDFDGAARLAQDALAHEPKNIDAYCLLARALHATKDALRSRLVIAQGMKAGGGNVGCLHHVLGLLLFDEQKTAEAISELETAIKQDPKLVEPRFLIAQISMGYKDFRKAAAQFEGIVKNDARNGPAWLNLGVAYKAMGRFAESEKAYRKAIEVSDGRLPVAHYNLGVLYYRNLKRRPEAKEELQKYLQTGGAGSDDPAFQLIEEIERMDVMEREERDAAAAEADEAKRQAEIDRQFAEEEKARKAADARADEAVKKESEGSTAPIPPPSTPATTPPKKPTKKESEPSDPGEPGDPG